MRGRILGGRYRLLSLLGQGGMGSVWRAEHIELGTSAAVKLIDPEIAQTEAVVRFKREARAAASLRGGNIVQLLDYGLDEGTPYTVLCWSSDFFGANRRRNSPPIVSARMETEGIGEGLDRVA